MSLNIADIFKSSLARIKKDASSNPVGILTPDGSVVSFNGVSSGYFCHYYAPSQNNIAGTPSTDTKLFDLLGALDGTFGANLSSASAWANTGFISTLDPAAGTTNVGVDIGKLGWDWKNGESLLVFWKGIIAPKAAVSYMMGQVNSTGLKGPEFRVLTSGHMQLVGYDASGAATFGPSTNGAVAPFTAGQEHSFAIALDPAASVSNNVKLYVDGEIIQSTFAMPKIDMLNSAQSLRLGSSSPTPITSNGLATQTRALVILKGRTGKALPTNLATTVRRLHRNPARLVTSETW